MGYISGWDRKAGKGALLSAGGTAVIEIHGAAKSETYAEPNPTALNLAWRLENASAVGAFYRQLAGKGVERIESPQDRSWGDRSFVVHDPDGIPVHIYCHI